MSCASANSCPLARRLAAVEARTARAERAIRVTLWTLRNVNQAISLSKLAELAHGLGPIPATPNDEPIQSSFPEMMS